MIILALTHNNETVYYPFKSALSINRKYPDLISYKSFLNNLRKAKNKAITNPTPFLQKFLEIEVQQIEGNHYKYTFYIPSEIA